MDDDAQPVEAPRAWTITLAEAVRFEYLTGSTINAAVERIGTGDPTATELAGWAYLGMVREAADGDAVPEWDQWLGTVEYHVAAAAGLNAAAAFLAGIPGD